jgi:tetratricopeptide (TPR) repeat protein
MSSAARVQQEANSVAVLVNAATKGLFTFALHDHHSTPADTAAYVAPRLRVPVRVMRVEDAGGRLGDTLMSLGNRRSCVFVTISDEAIPPYLPALCRETARLRRVPHAVMFWVSESGYQRITRTAPEFAAIHSRLFDFRHTALAAAEAPAVNSLVCGNIEEMRERAERCRADLAGCEDAAAQADLQNQLGFALSVLREYRDAARALLRSLTLSRRIGDRALEADNLFLLGQVALFRDRLRRAEILLTASAKLMEDGRDAGLNWALSALAIRQGDLDRAMAHAEASAATCRRKQDFEGLALALRQLAQCRIANGALDSAESALRELFSLPAGRVGARERALGEWQLAEITLRRGDLKSAEANMLRALRPLQELRDPESLAMAWYRLAMVAEQRGDRSAAAERLEEALWLWREAGREDQAAAIERQLSA